MLPRLAVYDTVYLAGSHAELVSKALLRDAASGVALADRHHSRRCEFGVWEAYAFDVAPLAPHVSEVICARSKKQVLWINARWVVAAMAHVQAICNWAVMKFPREAMRKPHDARWHMRFETPVAIVMCLSAPQPAPVRLSYLFPKAVSERGILHRRTLWH